MSPAKTSKRKAANGYRLPAPMPNGEIISAPQAKKEWRIGKSIGVGGFGEIYLASTDTTRSVGEDAPLAVKLEPHENGPLFVEMNFYIRAATPEMVQQFKKDTKTTSLGMPVLRGSGSHVYKGEKYRFLVMDRLGKDLHKIFQNGKNPFSSRTAFNLAIKIIDVLEYIHSKGYVHNDIKAQNLLLGYGRSKENDIYLVDFGLVSKYHRDNVHLEYKPDARKAHDGTIEYTSRDAHIGAHSRRSDLEILGYNLVHWMSGTLPWINNLTNPKNVHAQKKFFMENIPASLRTCFGDVEYPAELESFLHYAADLEFDTAPDYDHCRNIFKSALKKRKHPLDGKIDFSAPKSPVKKIRKSRQRGHILPTPAASPECESGAVTRSGENEDMEAWCWERILCSDPEMLIRQASRQSETEDEDPLAIQHKQLENRRQKESLKNPTKAMCDILKRIEQREKERQQMTWQQQLQHLTGKKQQIRNITWDLTPNPLTPAMEEVIAMRSKRISFDYDIPITPDPSDSSDNDISDNEENGGQVSDSDSSHEEYVPSSCKKDKKGKMKKRELRSPTRKPALIEESDKFAVKFEEEEDEDGFGSLVLNESILNFLREDGTSLAAQREELKKYDKIKDLGPLQTRKGKEIGEASTSKEAFPPKTKKRRISIQNDVSPIRNKSSPPETETMKKMKKPERWVFEDDNEEEEQAKATKQRKAKEILPIYEEDEIDNGKGPNRKKKTRGGSKRNSPEVEIVPSRKRKLTENEENSDDSVFLSPAVPPVRKAKKTNSKTSVSTSAPVRRMRSRCDTNGWDWTSVLNTNPEKLLAKMRKK